ncbi:MAG: hypothetical protein HY744_05755 [Deltaproteobacteria bacterium]|nr:hypothetical protein [Deltaproteobacteria bacterium]
MATAPKPAAGPAGEGERAPSAGRGTPGFAEQLVLDSGRISAPEVNRDALSLAMRGEFQLRFQAMRDLRLQAPITDPGADTLGQTHFLMQWLRLTPTLQYRDKLKIVGQIDMPRGMVLGDTTRYVGAARDPRDALDWYQIHPRYLYLEYTSPIGLFRLGQQGSHWGMGLVANDGDHPALFGDYQRGSLVERLLFATRPFGEGHPLVAALGGDLVFEDNRARLTNGDRALQAVAALRWAAPRFELGLYGVYRDQERERSSSGALNEFTEELAVGVLDLAGGFNAPVPGADAFVFGQFEGAFIAGSTDFVRSIDQSASGMDERIRSYGGALGLGGVRTAGTGADRWGDVVVALEWGFASGDADPSDGTSRRFTFDPNHNVGLVLFDHVLAWKTARAATILQDPQLVRRPPPGLDLLPSEGGVFGATYLYPTLVVRPRRWLDLKAAAVIAQSTADLVDPFHYGALGNYANYEGGDERRHDLGLELDLGADGRIAFDKGLTIQAGAEGGLLLPGHAFDDAAGNALPPQYLLNVKLGMQF